LCDTARLECLVGTGREGHAMRCRSTSPGGR
jgi:hypothetical protein